MPNMRTDMHGMVKHLTSRSTKVCLDILDRFESHANTPNVCRKVHCDVKGSRIPANVSVAPDTPARGMKSCADDLVT